MKTIAEELLVSLLGQEENTNPELEERMDDEEEEENTESSGEVMEEVDQVKALVGRNVFLASPLFFQKQITVREGTVNFGFSN